ncbi:type IV secretion system protein [Azonexus hydrophilus]|uniref:Type IV secretion system protein n=1 Tax=Azonexus hydrophilus TaxID=418702 RepID=A0ABZ2XLK8_9RHOO
MFKKKEKTPPGVSPSKSDPVGNSPQTAYEKAQRVYFERVGSPVVERDRYFIIAALFAMAFIAVVWALISMMPLSRVVPMVVSVDKYTGEATAKPLPVERFKPDALSKQYFVVRWVRNLMEIDPYTTERSLSEAYENTRDKAIGQFTDYLEATKPVVRMKTERGLTRTVEIKSYSPLNENSSLVRLVTVERSPGKDPVRRFYAMTVHYVIAPPATEQEVMKNPLGLFVTHFSINEDLT